MRRFDAPLVWIRFTDQVPTRFRVTISRASDVIDLRPALLELLLPVTWRTPNGSEPNATSIDFTTILLGANEAADAV